MNKKKILALFLSLSLAFTIGTGSVPKVVLAESVSETASVAVLDESSDAGEGSSADETGEDNSKENNDSSQSETSATGESLEENKDSAGSEESASEASSEDSSTGESVGEDTSAGTSDSTEGTSKDKSYEDENKSSSASEDGSSADNKMEETAPGEALGENGEQTVNPEDESTQSDAATGDDGSLDQTSTDPEGSDSGEQSEIKIHGLQVETGYDWVLDYSEEGGIGKAHFAPDSPNNKKKGRVRFYVDGYTYKAGDILTIKSASTSMDMSEIEVLVCYGTGTGAYVNLGCLDGDGDTAITLPETNVFSDENPFTFIRLHLNNSVEGDDIEVLGITITEPVVDPDNPTYVDAQCPKGVAVSYYTDIYSRGFAWSTNDEVKENSLFYVKAAEGQNKEDVDWESEDVIEVKATEKDSTDVSDVTWHLFKAHVENLEHNTKYFFRTGNKDTGFSDVGSFTVEDDSDKIDSVRFLHLTDCQEESQNGYTKWAKVLERAVKDFPDSKFVAFTGDLTNDSHQTLNMKQWIWGLDAPKNNLLNMAIEPSSGNHDKYQYSFTDRFDINWADYDDGDITDQKTGGCYSFTYGDSIAFINLNTNEADGGMDTFKAQYEWLESQLKLYQNCKWKIVQIHKGIMSTGDHTNNGEVDQLRDWLPPLFAKYKVDLVLQGHDHVYTRSRSYYYGDDFDGNPYDGHEPCWLDGEWKEDYEVGDETRDINLEPNGTHYVTINYCASKTYPVEENLDPVIHVGKNPFEDEDNNNRCSVQPNLPMYGAVTIKGDVLVYDAYTYDASTKESRLFDTFAVDKNNDRGYRDRNEGKEQVELKGFSVESKQYDGRAVKLDVSRFVCEDPTVMDYTTFTYAIEGRNGTSYSSTTMLPKEVGEYTMTISISGKDKDHFGSQVIDFEITP